MALDVGDPIANHIIALARAGERNVDQLCDLALATAAAPPRV
jgi:hypothetical protein